MFCMDDAYCCLEKKNVLVTHDDLTLHKLQNMYGLLRNSFVFLTLSFAIQIWIDMRLINWWWDLNVWMHCSFKDNKGRVCTVKDCESYAIISHQTNTHAMKHNSFVCLLWGVWDPGERERNYITYDLENKSCVLSSQGRSLWCLT